MRYYIVHRRPGAESQVREIKTPSPQWDDAEEAKLEALAEGARQLVRQKLQNADTQKIKLIEKQLIQQWLKS